MRSIKLHLILAAGLTWLALALGSAMNPAKAVGSCAPCFKAGFETACLSCSAIAEASLATINSAILTSENAIGMALNEGIFYRPVPLGFPILYSQIASGRELLGGNFTQQVTAFQKEMEVAIKATASIAEAHKADIRSSSMVAAGDEGGCRAMEYGALMDQEPRSSLGWGWQYVTRGRFESLDGEPIGDSVGAPNIESEDSDGIQAAIVDTRLRASQVTAKEFQGLKDRAERAGAEDPTIADVLNPSILYSSTPKTFNLEPDSFGVSDDERADYLIQYLTADAPTFADDLQASAITPAQIKASINGQVDNLRFGLSMAVLDELIKLRQPRAGANPADAFLAEAMGETPTDTSSHDEFYYRLTHYRQKDPDWITRTVISDEYALAQQVQMEAEQLALKYERWLTKRQTTLLLAQAVANTLQAERKED